VRRKNGRHVETVALDPIRLVEVAYHLDESDERWLRSLIDASAPAVDGGRGIGAFYWTFDEDDGLRYERPVVVGASPIVAATFERTLSVLPKAVARRCLLSPEVLLSTSRAMGWGKRFLQHPLARMLAHPVGISDLLGFKVQQPGGPNVVILGAQPDIVSGSPKRARLLRLCAAHVAAAMRLRRAQLSDPTAGADAIVESDGRIAHLQGGALRAREVISDAAARIRYARGPVRRASPEEAMAAWRALIVGRWSMFEHRESDGRRYLVARRNDPELSDPRGLTRRERQVVAFVVRGDSLKHIAYELGLSASMVSRYLNRAMRKLGVRTRHELGSVVRAA
jgi:DNA-binding CsgD family transcriptional regulator